MLSWRIMLTVGGGGFANWPGSNFILGTNRARYYQWSASISSVLRSIRTLTAESDQSLLP